MKTFIAAILMTLSVPALACRLEKPIKLSELNLITKETVYNHETFSKITTSVSLAQFMGITDPAYATKAIELNITYPKVMQTGLPGETSVLGARVQFKGTEDFVGISDGYGGYQVERFVQRLRDTTSGEVGDLHWVRVLAQDEPKLPYVLTMSQIWVVNGEIKSIEITNSDGPVAHKALCVGKVAR
jgi:hypothetical protein